MSISANDSESMTSGYDPVLDDVIEEMANRLQAGEPVDGAAILARYPDRADSIRRLLPAMEVMAEFGVSASRLAAAGVSPGIWAPSRRAGDPGRLPHHPRGRPRRHGDRLRGRADLAGPSRGPEGPAVRWGDGLAASSGGSRPRPRPRPVCITRTSCRFSGSAPSRACTITRCSSSRAKTLAEIIRELRRLEGTYPCEHERLFGSSS